VESHPAALARATSAGARPLKQTQGRSPIDGRPHNERLDGFKSTDKHQRRKFMKNRLNNTVVRYLTAGGAALLLSLGSITMAAAQEKKDIVDTAVAAGSFQTLAKALEAAGPVDTLKGEGPFTVFAPTDEAFAKLPPGTLYDLLKPENKDKLTAILTYHVVPGKVMASQVVNLKSAKTVNGQALAITTENGSVMVDNAKVIKTDIQCSNGVIHVIGSVLLPK
jgi:uncharacterized surface protein with fasciclin (FAS1) repeats